MRIIIVSAANQAYIGLFEDLLRSIRHFSDLDALDVGILDVGLARETRSSLRSRMVTVAEPGWDIDLGDRMETSPHLRAMTARPFLPRYFPDHDIIVWLDADTWVQDPTAILLLVKGAVGRGFAAVPELDRAYQTQQGPSKFTVFHDTVFRECFGPELGAKLRHFGLINSGALAGLRDSPVWSDWAEIYTGVAKRSPVPHAEQAALNAAVWTRWQTHQIALLPATANWICSLAHPLWDPTRRMLVEPQLPHAAIGLVHLAGLTGPTILQSLDGSEIRTSLRLSDIERP